MKNYLIVLTASLISYLSFAQGTRILREPDINGNTIVFAYGGDLWRTDTQGENCTRLTSYQGDEGNPKISPDGKTVAFTAQYDGNTDVYTMPIQGGEPQRLTWHPGPDIVSNWTNDSKYIIFNSGRTNAPYPDAEEFWKVSTQGGTPERFIVPNGINGAFSPDASRYVYEPISPWESEFRNYRGGQCYPLWIFDMNSHEIEKITWTKSRDIRPVWIGPKIYFLSDRDLAMNIWEYDTQTKTVKQLTHFKEFDCKNLEGNGNTLVFENGGYLHTYKVNNGSTSQLEIDVVGDFSWERPHYEKASEYIEDYYLSPNAKRVVISSRGEILTIPVEDGSWRNITNSLGTADRAPAWSPDGQKVSWFSDESGEYQLIIADQFGQNKKAFSFEKPTFYYHPKWSPDSKYLSFYNERRDLMYVDTVNGKVTYVDTEGFTHPEHVIYGNWSPDSKWLTYTKRLKNEFSAIFIYSLEDKKSHQITDGMSNCSSPTWDQSGDYLYFLSSIDYGPNVGWLDMSPADHIANSSIYAFALNTDVKSPVKKDSGYEEAKKKDPKDKEGDKDSKEDKTPTLKIDLNNKNKRIVALPLPTRNYIKLVGGKEKTIWFTEAKPNELGGTLMKFELGKDEPETLTGQVLNFKFNFNNSHIALLKPGGNILVAKTEAVDKAEPIKISGVKLKVDPVTEAKQIFKEAWRYQRDYFYVKNVHGLDMDWVYKAYSPWIDYVKHRSDLNYVLDILGGETSIGHSFNGGGDYPEVESTNTGLLGINISKSNNAYQIDKIFTGELWNSSLEAPLWKPGITIKEGDYILAVNGIPININDNFYKAFENLANQEITLTVNSKPSLDGAKNVDVTTISSDYMLRRVDWVEGNRRKVDELSGGKLAYVWLPNTGGGGFFNFNRYYFAQKDKKGIIVDERDNHGGLIADYITDLLSRDLLGYFNNPIGDNQPFTAPNGAIFGPKVMLINEMAGSGGDMLPYMFKKRKLGKLVGTTTWGGLVGIWDVPGLIDGGYITAPRGGFYDTNGNWAVENEGVSPDVRVEQTPKLVIEGHDPQLEEGVKQAMEMLKTQEVKLLPQPADPIRSVRPN